MLQRSKLIRTFAALLILGGLGGLFTWYKFFREEPQPEWITGEIGRAHV